MGDIVKVSWDRTPKDISEQIKKSVERVLANTGRDNRYGRLMAKQENGKLYMAMDYGNAVIDWKEIPQRRYDQLVLLLDMTNKQE
jgi:hypothetical protein